MRAGLCQLKAKYKSVANLVSSHHESRGWGELLCSIHLLCIFARCREYLLGSSQVCTTDCHTLACVYDAGNAETMCNTSKSPPVTGDLSWLAHTKPVSHLPLYRRCWGHTNNPVIKDNCCKNLSCSPWCRKTQLCTGDSTASPPQGHARPHHFHG